MSFKHILDYFDETLWDWTIWVIEFCIAKYCEFQTRIATGNRDGDVTGYFLVSYHNYCCTWGPNKNSFKTFYWTLILNTHFENLKIAIFWSLLYKTFFIIHKRWEPNIPWTCQSEIIDLLSLSRHNLKSLRNYLHSNFKINGGKSIKSYRQVKMNLVRGSRVVYWSRRPTSK